MLGGGPSGTVELAASYALPLVLTDWVVSDARKRRVKLCYDFDSFTFFVWPILIPIYLFQTRGARAFLTLLWFAGIWVVAILVALGLSLIGDSLGG
jgi:hypothetical protein